MDTEVLLELDRSSLALDPFLSRHLIALPALPPIVLPAAAQPIARRAWEERARSEYVGVMVVRRLHGLLVDLNAPLDLQELALQMLLQEQQHAGLCMAAARSLGSDGALTFSLLELQRPRTADDVGEQLVEMVVSAYCVGEVVALALITHSIEVLPPSPYRDLLRHIARDEVLHGRLGEPLLRLLRRPESARWIDPPTDARIRALADEAVATMRARDVVEADEAALFAAGDPALVTALLSVGVPPSAAFRECYFAALDADVPQVIHRALQADPADRAQEP